MVTRNDAGYLAEVQPLPIDDALPELIATLSTRSAAVLIAPPGAGKTTRVPGALIDAGIARRVVMLEPRRVAARAAARRIASERGSEVGGEVGWHVRFDRKAGRDTRILVVTEGLLVRMLQDDPFLEAFDAVLLDEIHERSLQADLALAMARRVQRDARPELKIVAMSATLDAGPIGEFLDAPIVRSEGRRFPVELHHARLPVTVGLEDAVADAIREAWAATDGDVLAFLPGVREIRWTGERIASLGAPVHMLYGDLPPADQDAVLTPGGPRKIVLATNVAETSVTVPGVTAVVDSGFAKVMRRDPATGLDRLELVRISRGSAEQRAGRAGRLRPGHCWRIWTEREHLGLADRDEPEIRRVDLCGPALELMCWGERDPARFPWFEAPPAEALEAAVRVLRDIGAVDDGGVTPLGRQIQRLPVHPRLGRVAVEAARLGFGREGALIAAILGERDPVRGRGQVAHSPSDVLDRLDAVQDGLQGRGPVSRDVARGILRVAESLELPKGQASASRDDALMRAIVAGYPDRVARRRPGAEPRALMVGGRGVKLVGSNVDAELFVAVEVDAGERGALAEGVVRIASAVDPRWLRIDEAVEVLFEDEKISARKVRRYRDLVLSIDTARLPGPEEVSRGLAIAAARDPRAALGADREEVDQILARVACLRAWMPEIDLPEITDAWLAELLPELCRGKRSFAELRAAPVDEAIKEALPWKIREALDREAPERIEVPSGSRIRLHYAIGSAPVLAVRIQEMFGLGDTPRVAAGRVKVKLHLLSPNQRPQQITDDLAGFWKNTWPEVRKELRARYPRHSWPDDPMSAEATSRPKRRGS